VPFYKGAFISLINNKVFVNLMLALQRRARRMEGRVNYRHLMAVLLGSAFLFHSPQALGHSGPKKITSFTARFMNLEATTKETFRFNASLFNAQARPVIYALQATAPPGWNVAFKVQGMQMTSFQVDSNRGQDISIELTPSPGTKPGKYTIPVVAVSDQQESLTLNLEAVVKGNYSIELTTPNGLLSGEGTEGETKSIDLTLKNQGTLPVDNLNLGSQAPAKWSVAFEPAKIDRLDPGSSVTIVAHISVPDKTIAGDYLTTLTASNPNATTSTAYRLTVTTSWLTGWFGILVILIAVGIVYFLIRKYGRR
jgi:uncharacterized membrane protein